MYLDADLIVTSLQASLLSGEVEKLRRHDEWPNDKVIDPGRRHGMEELFMIGACLPMT